MEEINAGPTAFEDLPNLFHFKSIKNAPTRTKRRTNEDREIIAIVLTLILGFLLPKFARTGRSPGFAAGPLPTVENGDDEGTPDNINIYFSKIPVKNIKIS